MQEELNLDAFTAATLEARPEIGQIEFDVRKALAGPDAQLYRDAIDKEVAGIEQFQVMQERPITEVPTGDRIFGSFMLTLRKALGSGLWKAKARWVVNGKGAIPGVHTAEADISTHLPPWYTNRTLISKAAGEGWTVRSGDVAQAFLKGKKGVPIWMRSPIGLRKFKMINGESVEMVHLVTGNLYGKADSPRNFELAMEEHCIAMGARRCESDMSLWVRGQGTKDEVMFSLFCDDIIIAAATDAGFERFRAEFEARWGDCKFCLPDFILGCDVQHLSDGIRLNAGTKLSALVKECNFSTCKPKDTPLPPGTDIDVRDCPAPGDKLKLPYRRVLGKLAFVMVACRPDIAHAISQLSRVQANPGKIHWSLLMHVVKYCAGAIDHGVSYHKQKHGQRNVLTAYCDASWADIPGGMRDPRVQEGRRSTLGHVLFLNGGPIQWRSHVSKCVALSSAESELQSTVACAKDITHGRRLLVLLGSPQAPTPTTLYCDSTAAIAINSSRKVSSRVRHCEIKYFYCKGLVAQGLVRMIYTNTSENCSDLLTKALCVATFTKFRNELVGTSTARKIAGVVSSAVSSAIAATAAWWEMM